MERSRFIGIQLDESGNRRSRKTPNGRKHRWAAAYLVKDHCVGTERNDFGHLVERVNRWIVSGSRLLKTHLPPYQAAPPLWGLSSYRKMLQLGFHCLERL